MYMRYRGDGIGHLDPLVRARESAEHSASLLESPGQPLDIEDEGENGVEGLVLSEEHSSTEDSDSSSLISNASRDRDDSGFESDDW